MAVEQLDPRRVHAMLRESDRRLTKGIGKWQLTNAAYLTRYWELMGAQREGSRWAKWAPDQTEIEVNRLWRGVMTYKAALYRKSGRIECGPDPVVERGDAVVGGAVGNALWQQETLAERLDRCVELALLFPGSGIKVGVEEGRGPPLRRVWTRAIPWWEMLLDFEVTDEADERYRGHRYWMPKEEAEAKYGLNSLVGSQRKDFLTRGATSDEIPQSASSDLSSGNIGEWVEVVELCNLVDSISAKGGSYRGRLEVYILGQSKADYEAPVIRTPLPFADADGVGMPHIEPLIFNHEPSFPRRGVAPCERILPQLVEINTYRSKMAELTRRNARKGLYDKSVFSDDTIDKLLDGNDGQMVGVAKLDKPLAESIHIIQFQPPPAELWTYMQMAEQDYQMAWGQVSPAQGQSTDKGKTAYAVQIEQFWTETEIGYHGQVMTGFSRRLIRLLLRAVVRAMTSVEASAETDKGDTVALLPTGSVNASEAVGAEHALAAQDDGTASPAVSVDASPEVAVAEGAADTASVSAAKVTYQEWTVRSSEGHSMPVTIDALDGDFDIKFLEGARTPMTDAAVLQFLTTQFPQFLQMYQVVQKGGPDSVLARAWLKSMGERAQLPPELQIDALMAKAEKMAPPPPPPKQEAPPPLAEAPPEAAPPEAPPSEAVNGLVLALKSAAQSFATAGMKPLAALTLQAANAAQTGDAETLEGSLHGALAQVGDLRNAPPEVQRAVQVLGQVAQAMAGGAGA